TLMRHSTITLTLDRYAHLGLLDTAAALDKLPQLPGASPTREAMASTGTDGRHIKEGFAHYLPTAGDGTGRFLADAGGKAHMIAGSGDVPNLKICRDLASPVGSCRTVAGVEMTGLEPATFGLQSDKKPLRKAP